MTQDAPNETLQLQDQITEQVIATVMAKLKNASTYFINEKCIYLFYKWKEK